MSNSETPIDLAEKRREAEIARGVRLSPRLERIVATALRRSFCDRPDDDGSDGPKAAA